MSFIVRKLKIGYYLSDGRYSPHPGCQRAVKEAVVTLRKMGHTVVEVRKTTHELSTEGPEGGTGNSSLEKVQD